jgi:2-C-methyl-D-erythritol 4-phosphate cytidylyltransferase
MNCVAIVVAAGRGRRMRTDVPKQYLTLGGRTILERTLRAVGAAATVRAIILAVPPGDVAYCRREIVRRHRLAKVVRVVAGGRARQDSVANALAAVAAAGLAPDVVAIHDGVRPFVEPELFDKVVRTASHFGGALAATPVNDTIKAITDDGFVRATPDRRSLYRAQTPQAFQYGVLVDAFAQARRDGFIGTDDCQLVERVGGCVVIVEGSDRNLKITTPTDLLFARALWKEGRS